MAKRVERARMPTFKIGICNNKAFTLLELVVVIFIISLVLAVSFPTFTLQKDGKLKSEAGHIASILRYLNDSAISTKEIYAININFNEKTMHYTGPDGEKVEKIDNLSRITTQSKGNVSDGEVTVFLSPAGAGENFSIHLTGIESSMAVVFNALSGRVKVLEDEGI
ncbi:MAG: type II secretion system protein [Syntrophales bacterium]|jgi:prepilin-type N-terminal cleavage/methylation domain-containing protein